MTKRTERSPNTNTGLTECLETLSVSSSHRLVRLIPLFNPGFMAADLCQIAFFVLSWRNDANPPGKIVTGMLFWRGDNVKRRQSECAHATSYFTPLYVGISPCQIRKLDKVVFWRFFTLSPFRRDNSPTRQYFDLSTFRLPAGSGYTYGESILITYNRYRYMYVGVHNWIADRSISQT